MEKKYNNKIPSWFLPYIAISACFIGMMAIVKCLELIPMFYFHEAPSFLIFLSSMVYNLCTSGLFALALVPLYGLLKIASSRLAFFTSSFLLGVIIFMEIAFILYSFYSGGLMGTELYLRPFSETFHTIRAAISIGYIILVPIIIVSGFCCLCYFVAQKIHQRIVNIITSGLMLLSLPGIFFVDNVRHEDIPVNLRNYEMSKVWYFLRLSVESIDSEKEIYNEELVNLYLRENPEYEVPDKHYPLERIDNTPNVLGPYFRSTASKPDIVIILVESLGNDMLNDICCVPFLDSLAHEGLYWENCFSTTPRSFGAIPAITASVIGPRGFQFGNMPDHNSLFSVLKKNGYTTNVFYGGDFSFDCISEFLIAQDIDYMSPFYSEYKSFSNKKMKGNWWGYYDGVMFDKSIEILRKNAGKNMFNLLVTLTTHENLDLPDENVQQYYKARIDRIIAKQSSTAVESYRKERMKYAAMLYTDDCIRKFIRDYQRLPNYKNTIFVITGDHASGMNAKNELSCYRVPLLIWSPLLKQNKQFSAMVTHYDIVPSLISLLKNSYHLQTPELVHWVGNGLDTLSGIHLNKRLMLVDYSREMQELIYNDYFYWTQSNWRNECVHKIENNFALTATSDLSLRQFFNRKLELYKYIYRYVYYNNKLTKSSIQNPEKYETIDIISEKKEILCETPAYKPSEKGKKEYCLMYYPILQPKQYKKIRVTLKSDIFINDSLFMDNYMNLVFKCDDIDNQQQIIYKDKIVKFLKAEVIRDKASYKLNIGKEFILPNSNEIALTVLISSVEYDEEWIKNSKITIRNPQIIIEGIKK